MAYELILTDDAHADIAETLAYISRTLENPPAAARFLDELDACYRKLREYPLAFPLCRNIRLRQSGYHWAAIGSYLLFYRPAPSEGRVYILRLIYGGRDYEKLL